MAFDLNKKGDENKKFNPSKTENSSSKFDLTKAKEETPGTVVGKKNSSSWIFGLLGIAVLAGGLWYFLSPSNSATSEDISTPQVGQQPDTGAEFSSGPDSTIAAGTSGSIAETTLSTPANPPGGDDGSNESITSASNTADNSTYPKTKTATGRTDANTSTGPTATSLNKKVPATFSSGSAALNSVDDNLVEGIITFLAKNPNGLITLNGYASSDGDITVNQSLSQNRADSFKKYLVSKGVSPGRITALGRGIENPISSNDTETGRMQNRRVEIIIQ